VRWPLHIRAMSDAKLSPHDLRRVGVAAGCDPRTVRAYLRGDPTRSTTAARIGEALRALGFEVAPENRETPHPSPAD